MIFSKYNLCFGLSLGALTFLIYVNVLNAPFHFDDLSLLLENFHIRSFQGLFSDLGTDQRKFLTFATFAVNFKLNPFLPLWYRLVNIVLHFLTALFTAKALQALFRAPFFQGKDVARLTMTAWGAAFIFCVHPLQTDSVTYIWQRSEVLSGFFYALVLWSYWHGRVENKRRFIGYAVCFCLIGLYAKGSVMTAPLLILISEVMFFNAGQWIRRHKVLCLLGGATVICASLVFDEALFQVGFGVDARYFYTQCLVIWKYLQLTFVPVGQSVDHGFTWAHSFWEPYVTVGFAGLVCLLSAIFVLSKKYRVATFGALWFFVYLLPTSSVIGLLTPIFEHRLYFSLAGFGLCVSAVVVEIFSKKPKVAGAVLIIIVGALCVLTVMRNQVWRSRTALMEDAVRKSPDYIRPYFTLASYYLSEGRLDEAQKIFEKCIVINPRFADAHNDLGVIAEQKGKPRKAVKLYRKAIQYNPKYQDAYLNLARAYFGAGRIDMAWDWIETILKLNPDGRVYAYAAFLQMKAGRLDVAQRLLEQGFDRYPVSARLCYTQGLLHIRQGRLALAVEDLTSAVRYAPKWFSPYNDLGVVYFMQKKYALSRDALEQARALSPRNANVYLNLANVYHELGQYDKAEKYYQTSQYKGLLYYLPANFDGKDMMLLNEEK